MENNNIEEVQNKLPIGIVTDNACDLGNEILNEKHVECLHYPVIMGGKLYNKDDNITVKDLINYADKHKELPKTSQLTPKDLMEYFKELLTRYEQFIFICLGSSFSGTLSNAMLVAKELDPEWNKIFVVDSENLSSGLGLLVLKACKMRDLGKTAPEIVSEVKRCVPLVRTQFAINTLNYLHMGGRCSGTTRLFGTLLMIKPIIRVVDGAMVVAKKPIGYSKALESILEYVKSDADNIDPDYVMITHCMADKDAVYLRNELNKFLKCDILQETYADVIVSTHCGPRTIGVLYILKQ